MLLENIAMDILQDAVDYIEKRPDLFNADQHDIDNLTENVDFYEYLLYHINIDAIYVETQEINAEYVWNCYQQWQGM